MSLRNIQAPHNFASIYESNILNETDGEILKKLFGGKSFTMKKVFEPFEGTCNPGDFRNGVVGQANILVVI